MTELKYFLGRTTAGTVFAVYRGIFKNKQVLDQAKWDIPLGTKWQKTTAVSEWNFVGNDLIELAAQSEIEKYLPKL